MVHTGHRKTRRSRLESQAQRSLLRGASKGKVSVGPCREQEPAPNTLKAPERQYFLLRGSVEHVSNPLGLGLEEHDLRAEPDLPWVCLHSSSISVV